MKVVLVTGGTRGIGAAIARRFTTGYKVIACYKENDAAAISFGKYYGVKVIKLDVTDFIGCKQVISEIGEVVDILINAAGITADSMFHKSDPQDLWRVINVNLLGSMNMSRCVINGMRERGAGSIVNIGSVNAKGCVGQASYAAAKAGLIGFTKTLAMESAPKGVRVNLLAPGYTDTDMVRVLPPKILERIKSEIPLKRLGNVDEIAEACYFLAEASFCTGSVLEIDGGGSI